MAERDQLARALGGHDAGEPGDREHVALGRGPSTIIASVSGAMTTARLGARHALRLVLGADVDHARARAALVEVRMSSRLEPPVMPPRHPPIWDIDRSLASASRQRS